MSQDSARDLVLDLYGMFDAYRDSLRAIIDRAPAIATLDKLKSKVERLEALAGETDKLTDEQAEALLQRLTKHFGEPVMPIRRYCAQLETWARCIYERADTLRKELLPNRYDYSTPPSEAEIAQAREHQRAQTLGILNDLIPVGLTFLSEGAAKEIMSLVMGQGQKSEREYRLAYLVDYEEAAHQVERTLTAVHKSNLLARILYSGEKLRTRMCPEHKGHWSGIEFGDTVCPHKCQLTGWIQEEADQGKPLPGVQAVMMVPTGEKPGEVTMIRDVDGHVLGKATMQEVPKPPKPV